LLLRRRRLPHAAEGEQDTDDTGDSLRRCTVTPSNGPMLGIFIDTVAELTGGAG
jgi:hypothetical protein